MITGFAGGDRASRGRVKAFDARTGRLVWTFYTIPGPGELGHDTWPSYNDTWKHGGAAVWQTPAVDPELGLVYFSTGNPGPDLNGSVRPGDNLFSVSMVAIEAKTGKYRWHFQQVHHDIWDYDAVNPVVLMDVNMNGRTRKAVVEVGKTGWAYILDRETGKPLIGIDEKPVPQEPRQKTAATQPFPRGDAVVPQLIEMAPEGHTLVNDGRIFTPFKDDKNRTKEELAKREEEVFVADIDEPIILPGPAMSAPPAEQAPDSYSATPLRRYPAWSPRFWHGMDFVTWMRLLVRNRLAIAPSRLPLAALITSATISSAAGSRGSRSDGTGLPSASAISRATCAGTRGAMTAFASNVPRARPVFRIGSDGSGNVCCSARHTSTSLRSASRRSRRYRVSTDAFGALAAA